MKATTLISIALALSPAAAVPPENFGFPDSDDDTPLSVSYQVNGSSIALQPGTLFGIDVPALEPTIAVNETYDDLDNDYTGQYLLFMLDPDASYPENPQNRWIIHWWQEGLTKSTTQVNETSIGGTRLVNTTAPRVAYRRPRPPTNSSAHRYIQYLFEQPANFSIPAAYSGFGGSNSSRFPFERFLNDTRLGDPVAANYFYCSNQSSVPQLFVAAPGQQYPGGNGAMVTQGTNLPSSTSGTPSSTSTAPPTSTSTAAGNMLDASNSIFGMALAIGVWTLL